MVIEYCWLLHYLSLCFLSAGHKAGALLQRRSDIYYGFFDSKYGK